MFQSWSDISLWAGHLLEYHRSIQVWNENFLWLNLISTFKIVVDGRRKTLSHLWIASIKEIVLNLMGCTVVMMACVQSKCQQFTLNLLSINYFQTEKLGMWEILCWYSNLWWQYCQYGWRYNHFIILSKSHQY